MQRAVALLAAVTVAVGGAGCRSLLTGGDPGADDGAAEALPTAEEFVADVEVYLGALRDGDLDRAWSLVCQDGPGASDRDRFETHHEGAARPVDWELAYAERGTGTGRSSAPGGGGGTPSGADGTVELDDGTGGELRFWYERDGICRLTGDPAVVTAVDPSPAG